MTNDVRTFVVHAIEEAGGLHSVADLAQHGFPEPLLYMGKSAVYLGNEADEWRERFDQLRPHEQASPVR